MMPLSSFRRGCARTAVAAVLAGLAGLVAAGPLRAADRTRGMRVAVMDFGNGSGDAAYDALGVGLQSMITTDLAQVAALTLVERARLADIEAELALTGKKLVDPKTAVKVGKLAGASHLVVGTYTVVSGTMRLDARLIDVGTGAVTLAEKIEGTEDAFFELEKTLVQKLVVALGLQPAPAERARLARIHTADLEAFRTFSRGIALFDQKKYDEAVSALRKAAEQDVEFKLARLTLEEYEGVIARLRARADQLLVAQDQLRRLQRSEEADAQARAAARLFEIAGRKGEKDARARLTALHMLVVAYAKLGQRDDLMELRRVEDRFALERTADSLARAYWSEAVELFPKLPLVVTASFASGYPESMEAFDEAFAAAEKQLWDYGLDYPENRRNRLLDVLEQTRDAARFLHLDRAQEAELAGRFFVLGKELGAEKWWLDRRREALAKEYREVLALDRSTALFQEMTRGVENPWALKSITSQIEENRDIARAIEESRRPELVRELALLVGPSESWWARASAKYFGGAAVTPEGWQKLTSERALPEGHAPGGGLGGGRRGYVMLGGHPVWKIQGHQQLGTGPRTDARRAEELRYYEEKERSEIPALVVVEGVPAASLTLGFELASALPEDWWPRGGRPEDGADRDDLDLRIGAPVVSVLVGLRDIDCDRQEDPATKRRIVARPMSGYAVRIDGDSLACGRVAETERDRWDRKKALRFDELARVELGERDDRLSVTVSVDGGRLGAQVGGRSVACELPSEARGFFGLLIEGPGFVALRGLTAKARE